MTAQEDRRRPRRRRATVRGLLVLVAATALGLAGYRHVTPWLLVREVHPQMAPLAALFDRPASSFRCAACHSQPMTPGEDQMMAILAASPHGPNVMLDCKRCHNRQGRVESPGSRA